MISFLKMAVPLTPTLVRRLLIVFSVFFAMGIVLFSHSQVTNAQLTYQMDLWHWSNWDGFVCSGGWGNCNFLCNAANAGRGCETHTCLATYEYDSEGNLGNIRREDWVCNTYGTACTLDHSCAANTCNDSTCVGTNADCSTVVLDGTLDCGPVCDANMGSACNVNACGAAGGTIQCNGSCSGGTPAVVDACPTDPGDQCNLSECSVCVPNTGEECNFNACGVAGGTVECGGSCSGPEIACTPPANHLYIRSTEFGPNDTNISLTLGDRVWFDYQCNATPNDGVNIRNTNPAHLWINSPGAIPGPATGVVMNRPRLVGTYSYFLRCFTGAGPVDPAGAVVTVNVAPPPPPLVEVEINNSGVWTTTPPTLNAGDTVKVRWDARYAYYRNYAVGGFPNLCTGSGFNNGGQNTNMTGITITAPASGTSLDLRLNCSERSSYDGSVTYSANSNLVRLTSAGVAPNHLFVRASEFGANNSNLSITLGDRVWFDLKCENTPIDGANIRNSNPAYLWTNSPGQILGVATQVVMNRPRLTGTHSFFLRCYTSSGIVDPAGAVVTVTATPPPPPTLEVEINNSGVWTTTPPTLNVGDTVRVRWNANYLYYRNYAVGGFPNLCTGSGFNNGGQNTNMTGTIITAPAPGTSVNLSLNCSERSSYDSSITYSASSNVVTLSTTASQPNLTTPSISHTVSGYSAVTGMYTSLNLIFSTRNDGTASTGVPAGYLVELDRNNDGTFEESKSTSVIGILGAGVTSPNISETFSNVPLGTIRARVTVDTGDVIDEINEGDNSRTVTLGVLPEDPGLSLQPSRDFVRGGEAVTLSWSATSTAIPMNCRLFGPGVDRSFVLNAANVPGSWPTQPIWAKSEFTLTCTETTTGTEFTERMVIQTTGTIEER